MVLPVRATTVDFFSHSVDRESCIVINDDQEDAFLLFFYVLLIVHIGIILVNNQPDAQFFFVYVYFNSLHISSIQVLIIRRFSCMNMISGVCHSM
jgi:hypothetical protein